MPRPPEHFLPLTFEIITRLFFQVKRAFPEGHIEYIFDLMDLIRMDGVPRVKKI